MKHEPGTYIRLRISPKTIRQIASVGGRLVETVIGVNSAVTGFRLKKSLKRQAKISSALHTGKNVTEIVSGIASAISKLLS